VPANTVPPFADRGGMQPAPVSGWPPKQGETQSDVGTRKCSPWAGGTPCDETYHAVASCIGSSGPADDGVDANIPTAATATSSHPPRPPSRGALTHRLGALPADSAGLESIREAVPASVSTPKVCQAGPLS